MSNPRRIVLALGALLTLSTLSLPALADGHGGGSHGGGGGGGHSGGHMGGGGGHPSGGHPGGGHFAGGSAHGGVHAVNRGGYQVARPGFAHSGYGARGYGYGHGNYWHGGYWRGSYWPRAYYGAGFRWFLPILPAYYSTLWFGSIPYYYADDAYYTWDPGYNGYVATDPPPAASGTDTSGAAPSDGAGAADNGATAAYGGMDRVFMYPRNGQNDQQQATDRRECEQWGQNQASQTAAGNSTDQRRAMIACLDGRGYSAN